MIQHKRWMCVVFTIIAALGIQPKLIAGTTDNPSQTGTSQKKGAIVQNAAQKGIPLNVTSNLADKSDLQAVLIPAVLARRIFGKEVANNYAVVEVIVANLDSKASLVVQDIFLDYSNWLLSGASGDTPPTHLTANQKANISTQVASVESRLVRGELLDAQQWTARNWTMRSLTALGSIAVAFEFPFSTDVTKGVGAFNGVVVPGAQALWPDGTINQINRISDFGFQTNKIIAKQNAEPIVAFFPIDRFLTPGFRKVFLKSPASWFVPEEMLADPKTEPVFEKFVKPLTNLGAQDFLPTIRQAVMATCPEQNEKAETDTDTIQAQNNGKPGTLSLCQLKQLLQGVSLNKIHVVVQGVMTVDQATVPGTIYSVDFKNGNNQNIWTTTKSAQTGTIRGIYLSGVIPSVVDAQGSPLQGVTISAVSKGSTDAALNFTMTIENCIPSTTKVFFVVTKTENPNSATASKAKPKAETDDADTSIPSTPFEFSVQPGTDCKSDVTTKTDKSTDEKK